MIQYYEIRKVNKEQVLILYLSFDYEFATFNGNSLLNKINHFIAVNHLKWKGNKVLLVVGGLVLGSLVLGKINVPNTTKEKKFDYVSNIILNHYDDNNNQIGYSQIAVAQPVIIENNTKQTINTNTSNNNGNQSYHEIPSVAIEKEKVAQSEDIIVTLNRSDGSTIQLELEQYLIGVVGVEMPASFPIEALKAQAIASRTYALKYLQHHRVLTDNEKTQSYRDNDQLRVMWGKGYDTYYQKVISAVRETKGIVITYNNEYIEALYHSTSNGYTESSYEVFGYDYPYLVTVSSLWDMNASSYLRERTFSFVELSNILNIDFHNTTLVEILEKTLSGRILSLRIDDSYYTGIELRNLLGLRSADFDIHVGDDKVTITTRGYGHGVGMSQYGASGMAKDGKSYIDILKHYYPGTSLAQIKI